MTSTFTGVTEHANR